jgi:hypothetical protein
MSKVACTRCGAMILPATATRTSGLCMPCFKPRVRLPLLGIARQPSATFTLTQYLRLVAGLPLPTQEQRENFVDYVSHAHSWYKHLPLYLPGVPFYFFIDKYAGCDRMLQEDGTAALRERIKRGFHYSDIPTGEYRSRFGHLAYSCGAGSTVLALGEGPIAMPRDETVAVPGDDAEMYWLPPEILDAGQVRLTAVIHEHSVSFHFWDTRGLASLDGIEWPRESGGQATLKEIWNRCRQVRLSGKPGFSDPVLRRLFQPERERQSAEIIRAIDRVCRIIEAAKEGSVGVT